MTEVVTPERYVRGQLRFTQGSACKPNIIYPPSHELIYLILDDIITPIPPLYMLLLHQRPHTTSGTRWKVGWTGKITALGISWAYRKTETHPFHLFIVFAGLINSALCRTQQ